jgi:hypothetical protein
MDSADRVQPSNFFRAKLLSLTTGEQISYFVAGYEQEANAIKREVVELSGTIKGLSRTEAWAISPMERRDYFGFIEERMKIMEKTKLSLL